MARRPTVDEAVSLLRVSKTGRYRVRCLADWKEKYGSDFIEQVEREFAKTRKGK